MNRRTFLQLLASAGVAVVAAPKDVFTSAVQGTLPPINVAPVGPVIEGLQTIRITFPGGEAWTMQGFLVGEEISDPIDGLIEKTLSFQPSGPCTLEPPPPSTPKKRGRPGQAVSAEGTSISVDGVNVGDIQDITLPSMQRNEIDVTRNGMFGGETDEYETHIVGLRRMGPLTFTVNFEPGQ